MPLNSLEHGLCTTLMTKIGPDQDSNPVSSHSRIEWAIRTASLFQTQNKLIRVPINVASTIFKHDKKGMGPSLGSCRLALDTYVRMWGVRSCLELCGPGCECWTMGPCKLLYLGPTGSGVTSCLETCRPGCESLSFLTVNDCLGLVGSGLRPCLGRCGFGCESLPKTMRARCESLPMTSRLGCESCLGPVGTVGRPCPGPCGLECEFLLRSLRDRLWVLA